PKPPNPGVAADWWRSQAAFMGQPTVGQQKELNRLAEEHGIPRLAAVLEAWKERPRGTSDLEAKWQFFLTEFQTYLPASQTAEERAAAAAKQNAFNELQSAAMRASNTDTRYSYAQILQQMQAGTYEPPPPKTEQETVSGEEQIAAMLA